MLAQDETKSRRIVQTPTMVLFVRDWTILLVTVWKATGKSWDTCVDNTVSEIQGKKKGGLPRCRLTLMQE